MAESKARNTDPRYSKLTIGVCPDQWGVWFPQDEKQIDWDVALDEMATAGFSVMETGPFGYFPTEPAASRRRWTSAASRSSPAPAGASCTRPRPGPTPRSSSARSARPTPPSAPSTSCTYPRCSATRRPATYTDDKVLSTEAWNLYIKNADKLGRIMKEDYGLKMVLHPHGDSHIETPDDIDRIFQATDPEYVGFCLDTGHIIYGDGDPMELCRKYPERISYVHIKAMDPGLVKQAHDEDWPFVKAVHAGCLGGAARRPARHARPHRGARRPRQGALRGLRAGHVRLPEGRPPAHRRPDPRVPRLARSRHPLKRHDSDRPHRNDRPRRHGAGAHRAHPHRDRRWPRRRRQRRRPGPRGRGRRAHRRRGLRHLGRAHREPRRRRRDDLQLRPGPRGRRARLHRRRQAGASARSR